MTTREFIDIQLDTLPESVLQKIAEFIAFQKFSIGQFDNDTDYLLSIPGMVEKIKTAAAEPLEDGLDAFDL